MRRIIIGPGVELGADCDLYADVRIVDTGGAGIVPGNGKGRGTDVDAGDRHRPVRGEMDLALGHRSDVVEPVPTGEQVHRLVRRPQQGAGSPAPARWRLFLLAGLWGYLIVLVAWKLLH